MNVPLTGIEGVTVVSVGEFSARLRGVFRRVRAFELIGVSGEVSEFTERSNGVYFTLKDANVVLQCFAHPNRARTFPKIALGTAVIAYGTVRVADWRSRYELLVNDVRLTGIGELFAQYEALKERFRALGFFERARKKPVPAFPRVVALVSARGKGAEDFQTTLSARAPQVRIEFVETRVQGIGADVEIADAIDRAGRSGADVIVLARGGGSYEDLFAFNLEPVVRAIVRSKQPVITGIGHTGDHHLADDVADLACETPSNAAQYLAQQWQRGGERLSRLSAQLDREMRDQLARALQRADVASEALTRTWERTCTKRRDRLAVLERRLLAHNPSHRIAQRVAPLAVRKERLVQAAERYFAQRTGALELASSRLTSSDPLKPLERGYAIVLRDGRALRDARDSAPGDEIEARLFVGSLTARVERVNDDG
ncbi:MAG: exodeoxyribonuclease VII large subunit [Candidatus Eremiobacteraeota bacterium]|nr:exodeoxyribonuclease VII large subunit [Candidatus Eremiobacteraeota bacterium]MBV8284316.1 exodeoxyribonuclease VII large subunit [Candidatus Eremiobacteraeota bacterium]MBV8433673.1 exodeoxyribonuclease VII large subunit [Candidatus Eremiobacteraeota bacterium]